MNIELKAAEAFLDVKVGIDGIIKALKRLNPIEVVDFKSMAAAAGVPVTDNTTLGDIQRALRLSDSNTIQDAINALSY